MRESVLANLPSHNSSDYVERLKEYQSILADKAEFEINKQLQEIILLSSRNVRKSVFGSTFASALAPLQSAAFDQPHGVKEIDFQNKLAQYFRQNAIEVDSDDVAIDWIVVSHYYCVGLLATPATVIFLLLSETICGHSRCKL